jgi:hypothetical protein
LALALDCGYLSGVPDFVNLLIPGWRAMNVCRCRALLLAVGLTVVAGCSPRNTLETEMRIAELEDYAMQLETQLNFVYTEVSRISQSLSTEVTNVEAALTDVHLRVADLPLGDLAITMREVEAAVAVANQRVAALRVSANNLSQMTDY